MATRQGVRFKFQNLYRRAQFADEIIAKTGRNLGAGLVLWSSDIPVNAVYVRSPENNAITWAWGRVSDVDVDVVLKPQRNGQYQIDGPDWTRADAAWGSDLTGAIQPPLDGTKYGNVLVASLTAGRVYPSNSGGLNVRIAPHYYLDGSGNHVYYPDEDDLDLTSSLPGSSDEWCWVKVGMDRTTNTAIVIGTSTPKSITEALTEDELAGIALGGDTPHGGIRLRNGQTGIPAERGDIVDCRVYF